MATLAFLEKNKDLYPDAYKKALNMYSTYKCDEPNPIYVVDLAFAMQGLLKGLSTIESDKK